MLEERIRFKALQSKLTDPATAAKHIHDGTNLFISGFTAGYPKMIPLELARRAASGEQFKVNLFAGASTGDEVDGIMAEAGVIGWRRPYMSSRSMRKKINENKINATIVCCLFVQKCLQKIITKPNIKSGTKTLAEA